MASNLGELVATASLDIQPFIGNTWIALYQRWRNPLKMLVKAVKI